MRCGAAMSAPGPRGQQNTAGEAAQPRWPRAADKRDPTRGSSQAAGSLTAAGTLRRCCGRGQAHCLPREGRTISVLSQDQGSPQACPGSDFGSWERGCAPGRCQGDGSRNAQHYTAVSLLRCQLEHFWVCPMLVHHPFCRGGLSRETHRKGICFGGFLCIGMLGLCTRLSQCSPSITWISHGSEKPECRFQCT